MVESSGLLLFRKKEDGVVEVLVGHMGGPFWARKHEHAWSVPKGLHDDEGDDHLAVAIREFMEEMGSAPPDGPTIDLGFVKSGNKRITVFAREGEFRAETAVSNTFKLEWPRGSGEFQEFPEIDKAAWISVGEARDLLVKGQVPFLDRLMEHLGAGADGDVLEAQEPPPTLF